MLLLTIGHLHADAGRVDLSFSSQSTPNGKVHAILALPDGSTIIGGEFTQIGAVQQAYLARFDTDGSFDTQFNPALDGPVYCLEETFDVSLSGSILHYRFYAGGSFTTVNQIQSRGIAKLITDGTLDNSFFNVGSGFDGTVYSIHQTLGFVSPVMVGGDFSSYQGNVAHNLVTLNYEANLVQIYNANGTVYDITESPTYGPPSYICVGSFSSILGHRVSNIASVDAYGNFDQNVSWPAVNGSIKKVVVSRRSDLVLPDPSTITIAGNFSRVGGVPVSGAASMTNSSGSLRIITFGSSGASSVTSLLADADGRLLVANQSGSIWAFREIEYASGQFSWKTETSFLPHAHANAAILALSQSPDGRYYIGGDFSLLDNQPYPYFTRLLGPFGSAVPSGPDVEEFKPTDNKAFIKLQDGQYRQEYELAVSSDDGVSWRLWLKSKNNPRFIHGLKPSTDYRVRARVSNVNGWSLWGSHATFSTSPLRDAGTLAYVPDPLPLSKGSPSSLIVDSNGHLGVIGVGSYQDSLTGDLAVVDDRLQLQYKYNSTNNPRVDRATPSPTGGCFIVHSSDKIEKLTPTGTIDPGFSCETSFGFYIRDIAVQSDGKLLVAGDFTTAGGAPNDALVRLNANGEVDTSYAPVFSDGIRVGSIQQVITLSNDGALAIGEFDSVNGIPAGQVVKLTSSGSVDTSFSLDPALSNFWIFDDAVVDTQGRVILAGLFQNQPNGGPREGVQRLNADGSLDSSWNEPVMSSVRNSALSVDHISMQSDGKFIVAGSFTMVNGQTANGMARLNSNGTLDTTFDAGLGLMNSDGGVYSPRDLICLPNGNIAIVGWFNLFDGITCDDFALIRGNPPITQFQQWLLIHGLPLDSDPTLDNDGDGIALAFEFAYHLNPHHKDAFKFFIYQGTTANIIPPKERTPTMQGAYSSNLINWQNLTIRGDWRLYPPDGSPSTHGFHQLLLSP